MPQSIENRHGCFSGNIPSGPSRRQSSKAPGKTRSLESKQPRLNPSQCQVLVAFYLRDQVQLTYPYNELQQFYAKSLRRNSLASWISWIGSIIDHPTVCALPFHVAVRVLNLFKSHLIMYTVQDNLNQGSFTDERPSNQCLLLVSRALNILTRPRQLDLPVKRAGTGIRLGARCQCLSVRDNIYHGVEWLASPPPDQREPSNRLDIHKICNQITETKLPRNHKNKRK